MSNLEQIQTIVIKDTTSNPAPLGLLGFGLTTLLLNLHNAGLFPVNSMIMGMGIFVGGIAQIIAGIQEWKKNNTFGATAFTAYGSFWLALVAMWVLPNVSQGINKTDENAVGWFLLFWGIFTAFMFVGTLKMNRAIQVVFGSLLVLFFLLAIGDFTGSGAIKQIAGFIGIFCGASALYLSFAQILNEVYGKVVMPVGPMKK